MYFASMLSFCRVRKACQRAEHASQQRGVVLIIALILLVVISLLAVTSIRNVGSSENVSANVRTTELATQAAEIALRHCESSAIKLVRNLGGDTTSPEATYDAQGLGQAQMLWNTTAIQWQSATNWDTSTSSAFVLPSSLVGGSATFKRPPECMVESLTGSTPPAGAPASFLVTARGFGPEVPAADANRTRPLGSVVWLQSTIDIQ